jgi:site-specific recombinase XerD
MNNENFFIVDRDKKKMTRNNFTRFLNSIFIPFNKQVSSTMLRHIIISELYQLDEEKEKIKRDLSKKMGHAMSSSGSFYAKLLTKA